VFCLLKLPAHGIGLWFLKRWKAEVCELASAIGSEFKAHSGLRRMQTWKSLRIISDEASDFDTVIARILSLAFAFVTPSQSGE